MAIMFFTGLRLTEANRLEWGTIDLAEKFIKLSASITKTKRTRRVDPSDNALDWLAPYAARTGRIVPCSPDMGGGERPSSHRNAASREADIMFGRSGPTPDDPCFIGQTAIKEQLANMTAKSKQWQGLKGITHALSKLPALDGHTADGARAHIEQARSLGSADRNAIIFKRISRTVLDSSCCHRLDGHSRLRGEDIAWEGGESHARCKME